MPGENRPAVGDRVEISFAPIPSHVKADSPPEVAGAAQSQAQEKADQSGGYHAHLRFPGIGSVNVTKSKRQQGSGRPEVHSFGKHPLGVPAQQEIFKQRRDQKENCIVSGKFPDARPMQSQRAKLKSAHQPHRQHQDAEGTDAPQCTHPKVSTKSGSCREPKVAKCLVLNASHGKTRHDRSQHHAEFDRHSPPEPADLRTERYRQPTFHQKHHPANRQINQPSRAGIESFWADQNILERRFPADGRFRGRR